MTPGVPPSPWRRITLVLPRDSRLPTIGDHWRRLADGTLEAVYSRAELETALWVANAITLPVVPVQTELAMTT